MQRSQDAAGLKRLLYGITDGHRTVFTYHQKKEITSEEAGDVAVCIDIDLACGGLCGKTRHRHNFAGFNDDKSSTVQQTHSCGSNGESGRAAKFVRIIG